MNDLAKLLTALTGSRKPMHRHVPSEELEGVDMLVNVELSWTMKKTIKGVEAASKEEAVKKALELSKEDRGVFLKGSLDAYITPTKGSALFNKKGELLF